MPVWRSQRVNDESPYLTVPYCTILTVIVPYIIDTDKLKKDIHVDKGRDIDRDRDKEAHIEGEMESVCV